MFIIKQYSVGFALLATFFMLFLAWFILRLSIGRLHVRPKRRLTLADYTAPYPKR
jgi:hypothetical protein